MRLRKRHAIVLVPVLAALAVVSYAIAGGGSGKFDESLSGYQEDPLTFSTTGNGTFTAQLSHDGSEISYRLSYANLEGSVLQSHIHFGQAAASGGISVFLCTNLGNGPAGTQACPAAPATITGTITAANVIGPTGQGITAGQLGELVRAMKAGVTYVNVHTSLYPGGEIRAQLDNDQSDDD
jgi:CHRD domain-containing protein